MNVFREGLSFDDVLLVPQYGVLGKRVDADISGRLVGNVELAVPLVSAPMQSVTERSMALAMTMAGGFGVIHRFMPIEEQAAMFKSPRQSATLVEPPTTRKGAAIGVNEGYDRWDALHEAGCRIFCLDIAHAHHSTVEDFLSNRRYADEYIIAGNVATRQGAEFLADLAVDCIKVGIGPGAACTTREVTGFGVPQLTAIMDVAKYLEDSDNDHITLMADGGIKSSGDIVKALAAGADTVMLGKLLAGADESPHPGLYWGMASAKVNKHRAPEGIEGTVPRTGPVADTIKSLAWGIRSGVSYGGGTNLATLRHLAEFVRVSGLSTIESGTRLGI